MLLRFYPDIRHVNCCCGSKLLSSTRLDGWKGGEVSERGQSNSAQHGKRPLLRQWVKAASAIRQSSLSFEPELIQFHISFGKGGSVSCHRIE